MELTFLRVNKMLDSRVRCMTRGSVKSRCAGDMTVARLPPYLQNSHGFVNGIALYCPVKQYSIGTDGVNGYILRV